MVYGYEYGIWTFILRNFGVPGVTVYAPYRIFSQSLYVGLCLRVAPYKSGFKEIETVSNPSVICAYVTNPC